MHLNNDFIPDVFHNFSQVIYFSMLNIFKMTHPITLRFADQPRSPSRYPEEVLFSV